MQDSSDGWNIVLFLWSQDFSLLLTFAKQFVLGSSPHPHPYPHSCFKLDLRKVFSWNTEGKHMWHPLHSLTPMPMTASKTLNRDISGRFFTGPDHYNKYGLCFTAKFTLWRSVATLPHPSLNPQRGPPCFILAYKEGARGHGRLPVFLLGEQQRQMPGWKMVSLRFTSDLCKKGK